MDQNLVFGADNTTSVQNIRFRRKFCRTRTCGPSDAKSEYFVRSYRNFWKTVLNSGPSRVHAPAKLLSHTPAKECPREPCFRRNSTDRSIRKSYMNVLKTGHRFFSGVTTNQGNPFWEAPFCAANE
ncbi:hypothetical protein TNIN_103801 [Trichonephila inaurata madagascariensis]|uniref:Uncharacterized protein n=1 Tax=Trichonephila inaurata madagascariensis TaxID=2747483 RepID=A0A8X6XAT8_9ARAC|nr:hypothetical protein TNIN_103801 [Trichonephila inaurata madagascariensis]